MSQPPSERQLRMSTTRLQLFWNHVIVIFRQRRRIRTTGQHADASANDKLARQLFAYEMLATRRNQQDSMLWQVPALALTAQAFLLTIALGGDAIPAFSRALAAGLGLVVACMTMQLMAKHRHLTELDNAWLALMEREIGIAPIAARDIGADIGPRRSRYRRARSYVVWEAGLALFALTNIAILLIVVIHPRWL